MFIIAIKLRFLPRCANAGHSFLSVLLQICCEFHKSSLSPFPSFGEGGVAESRGGRWIHNVDNKRFMHSPTTSPRVLLLPEGGELQILSTINCLAIIFLINFVSKSDKKSFSVSFYSLSVSFNLLYSFLIRCNPVQSGKSPVSCRIFVSPPERENVLPFGENKILNYGNSNCGALQAQKTNWR